MHDFFAKANFSIIETLSLYSALLYDVASESEIRLCIKIDKPLVVYRFSGNVMTSITTLSSLRQNYSVLTADMRFQKLNVI